MPYSKQNILLSLVAIALLLTAVWGLILANRKRVLRRRRSEFFQKNQNKGICEISYGLSQMLKDAGIAQIGLDECLDDVEYARRMEEKLEGIESGEYVQFIRLTQQAAYGRERMTEEQRQDSYAFYRKIAVFLVQGMSRRKKIWWKYMKCYEIS